MNDFVKIGKLTSSLMNNWDSSDDHETLKSLPLLKAVNETGFVTTDSQIGVKIKDPLHVDGHKMLGHAYQQRAYLTGIVHKNMYHRIQKLSHTSDLAVNFHGADPEPKVSDIDVLFKYGNRVPVTIWRNPGEEYKETTWSVPTMYWKYEWSSLMPQAIAKDKRMCSSLRKNGACVQIIDLRWGRPFHLLQELLEVLQGV